MKLLHAVRDDAAILGRFQREFRALSRLFHPNVLRVEEWGIHQGRPWFTMELVEGADLRVLTKTWAQLEPAERFANIQTVAVQVARALAYIHERGLVHRDVTPGNIMLHRDGSVKLMDFGLVTDRQADLTTAGEILGTIAHTAPEQLHGDSVDARTDLYALGTVLYQLLTGQKPFAAHTVQGWLEQHLHHDPRPPKTMDPLVPDLLNEVCLRLLSKRPEDRYASAVHLLQVLGDTSPATGVDAWPPQPVGRAEVRADLHTALDELADRTPGGVIVLSGAEGMGKSRLLSMVGREAMDRDMRVFRVDGGQQSRAFEAFAGLYADIRPDPPIDVLEQAFEAGAPTTERYPVMSALRDLIAAHAPYVMLIDDHHRADAASQELLEYLVRNSVQLDDQAVLYVVASERPASAPELRPLQPKLSHTLDVLSHADVEELVLTVLPADERAGPLAQQLYDETAGHPGWISDVLRDLVEHGMLRERDGRWDLAVPAAEIEHTQLPIPASLRRALDARLARLPQDAVEVARNLAVIRDPVAIDLVVDIVPFDEERCLEAIDQLIERDVVRELRRGDQDILSLNHTRLADRVLQGVPEREVQDRHRAIAAAMEATATLRPGEIAQRVAWHHQEAGQNEQAFRWLARAGAHRLQQTLFDDAADLLAQATVTAALAIPDAAVRELDPAYAALRIDRADALYQAGRWDEAVDEGTFALELPAIQTDASLTARLRTLLGELERNRGRLENAREHLVSAVDAARRTERPDLEPRALYQLGATCWATGHPEQAEQHWRDVLERSQRLGDGRAEGLAHNGLGILEICNGNPHAARRLLETAVDIFRDVGMVSYIFIAQVNLIELCLSIGSLRRAWQLTENTTEQAREVGHRHGICMGLVWRARLLAVLGRAQQANQCATEALRLAEQIGTVDEQAAALSTLAETLLADDQPERSLPIAERLHALLDESDGEGLQDHAEALMVQALARCGNIERAQQLFRKSREIAAFPHVEVRTGLTFAVAAADLGQSFDAESLLRRALHVSKRNGYKFYELLAYDHLARVVADPDSKQQNQNRARDLARTLSASLSRANALTFNARGWGTSH